MPSDSKFPRTSEPEGHCLPTVCDPAYPILRSGAILEPTLELTAEAAFDLAAALFHQHREIADRFMARLSSEFPELTNVGRVASAGAPEARLRYSPAITIDFARIAFEWNGHELETRACQTVCVGERRAKQWLRINASKPNASRAAAAALIAQFEDLAPKFRRMWLELINEVSRTCPTPTEMHHAYDLQILMTSSRWKNSDIADVMTTEPQSWSENREHLEQALSLELEAAIDKPLPDISGSGVRRHIAAYSFPRHRPLDQQDEQCPPVVLADVVNPDFNALCAIDLSTSSAAVVGVGLEALPPDNAALSAPFVVSGEISYELGRLF